MHSKVYSDWLPSYIKAKRPVFEIFKMAGYFPDSPRTSVWQNLNTSVRQKLISTFALFRDKVQFQFLQKSNVNRRTTVCKLLLLSLNIMLDVVSKLPAGRLRYLTGLRFFFSLKRPDRLWSPFSLLFNEYPGFCPRGQSCQGVCS